MNFSLSAPIQFLGHLHVLLVHLPIGFIILLAALETAALFPRFKHLAASSRFILMVCVFAAPITILCGWLLSRGGGYDADLLFWHKWLGTSVGVAVLILLFLHWRGWLKTYRVALYITLALLVAASHFGGSMTHGINYLNFFVLGKEPEAAATALEANDPSFYGAAIQPIFRQDCIACHGPHKSKGKLRLDTAENLFHGGDSGPTLVPGAAIQSLIIKRLNLPPDDDDHMPPDGKRQPSDDEISLIRWWIDSGASTNKTPQELDPPQNILHLLQAKANASL